MYVLIVGGGRVGEALALALSERGVETGVVEEDAERVEALRMLLKRVEVFHGDGDEPSVLEAAHVSRAGVLVALTDDDEDNLVACLLARREYAVPRTMGRVNHEKNVWLFGERFGVDEAVMIADLDPIELADRIMAADEDRHGA